eukprot:CAMPEP_0180629808 /NCGR_PEP_ID=MMETSP1037_2-20121125/39655_1 /TAXON_ID=632150 /ORGANISM="Azadinium spinosum, Strain 3D9" /LENGTH=112 /DNA_ID=CAMNT_0022650627 /DNA_START=217 /DNA_END=555 /DNA_ORIENTATION=-
MRVSTQAPPGRAPGIAEKRRAEAQKALEKDQPRRSARFQLVEVQLYDEDADANSLEARKRVAGERAGEVLEQKHIRVEGQHSVDAKARLQLRSCSTEALSEGLLPPLEALEL